MTITTGETGLLGEVTAVDTGFVRGDVACTGLYVNDLGCTGCDTVRAMQHHNRHHRLMVAHGTSTAKTQPPDMPHSGCRRVRKLN